MRPGRFNLLRKRPSITKGIRDGILFDRQDFPCFPPEIILRIHELIPRIESIDKPEITTQGRNNLI